MKFENLYVTNLQAPNNLVVDHHKVIKEYSRSSADQEEPLPHELRPSNVLTMTMDYLVCNVMDLYEDGRSSAEDWYDFLWNRTRGIRKVSYNEISIYATNREMLQSSCFRFRT